MQRSRREPQGSKATEPRGRGPADAVSDPGEGIRTRLKRRLKYARRICEGRLARAHFFPSEIFSDPGWDLLINLYIAHCEARAVTLEVLARSEPFSEDSATRWVALLSDQGHVCLREVSAGVLISLSESARESMDGYFDWLAAAPLEPPSPPA